MEDDHVTNTAEATNPRLVRFNLQDEVDENCHYLKRCQSTNDTMEDTNEAFELENVTQKLEDHIISLPLPVTADSEINTNNEDSIGCFERNVTKFQCKCSSFWIKIKTPVKITFLVIMFFAYNSYLGYAMYCNYARARILLGMTLTLYIGFLYYKVLKPYIFIPLLSKANEWRQNVHATIKKYILVKRSLYAITIVVVLIFLVFDTAKKPYRLISVVGLLMLLLMSFLGSVHPAKIQWSTIFWGIILQLLLGLIVIRWNMGRDMFEWIGQRIEELLQCTDIGTKFLFSDYSNDHFLATFAFQSLPTIIFISFLISMFYHFGMMQWIIRKIGWSLQTIMGTTAAESVNSAANMFLGMSQAPLIIAPYISLMTKSELHAVMTSGLATVAGSTLGAYIKMGINPRHLLSASVISAPASLAVAKLLYPEIEESQTTIKHIKHEKGMHRSALEAASDGAYNAIVLVASIAAHLIAILATLSLMDSIVKWFGSMVDYPNLSFEFLCSKMFILLAFVMGADWKDCEQVSKLIATKTMLNEFIAYKDLSEMIKQGSLSMRSQVIAIYALSGFTNFASVTIQIGILRVLAPNRKADLSEIALRALMAATIACFMTACIAGILLDDVTQEVITNSTESHT